MDNSELQHLLKNSPYGDALTAHITAKNEKNRRALDVHRVQQESELERQVNEILASVTTLLKSAPQRPDKKIQLALSPSFRMGFKSTHRECQYWESAVRVAERKLEELTKGTRWKVSSNTIRLDHCPCRNDSCYCPHYLALYLEYR